MQKHVSRAAFPTVPHGIGTLALTAVICLNTANSAKPLAMAMLLLTLFAGLFFRRKFREQAAWPLLFLFLITLIGGISVFYAVSSYKLDCPKADLFQKMDQVELLQH